MANIDYDKVIAEGREGEEGREGRKAAAVTQ